MPTRSRKRRAAKSEAKPKHAHSFTQIQLLEPKPPARSKYSGICAAQED